MTIQVSYHSGVYPVEQNALCQDVAAAMVHEFISENPSALGLYTQNEVINGIAQNLLNAAQTRLSPTLHDADMQFSTNILPEAMKAWAEAKKFFEVQMGQPALEVDQKQTSQVSLPPYTYSNTDWGDVETITSSKEGHRGVWFLSNATRGTVVIKGQEHADNQIMGNVFLRLMGINSPDAKMIGVDTPEGKQLTQLGMLKGLNFKQRTPDHYIVMDRVLGPSYTNLSTTDVAMVQKNLLLIGELAAYDLLLGNFDRFQLDGSGFNSGNIMFQDGVLVAIDTDCVEDEEREGWTLQAFTKFIKTPEKSAICQKLALKLGERLGAGVTSDNFSEETLSQGLWIGIRKLVELQSNMDLFKDQFITQCRARGVNITELPPHLDTHLKHIFKLKQQ